MAAQSPSPRALGATVRAQRQARDLTLEELAGAAGMHVTYVSDIEHGKSSPTVGKLGDIARAFDMRLSALIADAEDRAEQ